MRRAPSFPGQALPSKFVIEGAFHDPTACQQHKAFGSLGTTYWFQSKLKTSGYPLQQLAGGLVRFDNGMTFTFEDGWINNISGLQEGIFICGSKGAFRGETLFMGEGKWDKDDAGNRRRYQAKLVEKSLELPDMPHVSKIGDFLNACTSDAQPILALHIHRKATL